MRRLAASAGLLVTLTAHAVEPGQLAREIGVDPSSKEVAEGVPLEQLTAGDRITVLHTEALAVELEPQPAKKPAPKK